MSADPHAILFYGFVLEQNSAPAWLVHEDENGQWQAKEVAQVGPDGGRSAERGDKHDGGGSGQKGPVAWIDAHMFRDYFWMIFSTRSRWDFRVDLPRLTRMLERISSGSTS